MTLTVVDTLKLPEARTEPGQLEHARTLSDTLHARDFNPEWLTEIFTARKPMALDMGIALFC